MPAFLQFYFKYLQLLRKMNSQRLNFCHLSFTYMQKLRNSLKSLSKYKCDDNYDALIFCKFLL